MAREIDITKIKNVFPAESKNSTNSTFILFEARQAYEDISLQYIINNSTYAIPFSDSYKKNALYGFIDLEGDAIQPVDILSNFKSFGNDRERQNIIQDFAADAFLNMRLFLNNALLSQKMVESTVYKNLQVYSGYEDFDRLYRNHHYLLAQEFKSNSIENNVNNSKIKDHKNFISAYTKFLKNKIDFLPITKSQSMIFYNFFTLPSGLVFDIAKDSYDNDEIKFNKYLTDQGFQIFSEACLRFGFNIDKNIPWRLNANLNSPSMLPYMEKYGISNIKNLFRLRYKKIFFDDLEELKNAYYRAYIIFLNNNASYEPSYKELYSGTPIYFERKSVTYQEFIKDYPDQFWIRVYAYFKNYETKKNLTQTQFDNMVRETNELIKINKITSALIYLNDYFKDYNQVYEFSLQNNVIPLENDSVTNSGGNTIIL